MAFSPGGRRLFVAGTDASVHVYDAATGRQIHRILALRSGSSGLEVVAVSRNGKSLAIGYPLDPQDSNYAVSIYSTVTWRKQFTLMTSPQVQISALAFSPDGTRLAIGAEDGTAGVWSIPTRQQLVSYQGPTAAIDSIQFTPDGDSVLTASNDGVARLWRAIGVEQSFQTLPLATSPQQIVFDRDRIDATSSSRPIVYSAPIAGGRAAERAFPHAQTVVLSADGRVALGIGNPGVPLMIWDARTGRLMRKLSTTAVISANNFNQTTFAWNDASVAVDQNVGTGSGVVILSLTTGRTVSLQSPAECLSLPESFAFSRDDRRVAAAYFCGYADVWDARTGRLLRQVNEGGEVSGVDLSPDGSRLLVGSWDARATIWSVNTGRQLVNLIGDTRGLQGAAFSPDGSLAATSSLDDTVRIWNARTGQMLRVLSLPDAQGPPVFNASGSELAVAESDPANGAPDIVRVFATCPACTNARELLGLAAPQATSQLTVLESAVVGTR
jgi:WD40 repeat protein